MKTVDITAILNLQLLENTEFLLMMKAGKSLHLKDTLSTGNSATSELVFYWHKIEIQVNDGHNYVVL